MRAIALPAEGHRRQRWANGAGWTREVWAQACAEGGFDWRASLADISGEAAFSRFDGCDRSMLLVSGDSLQLELDGGAQRLDADSRICRFPGEATVQASAAAPVVVFNLIWRRDRYDADLMLRPLVGPMLFFPEPGTQWLLVLLAGRAVLDAGDEPVALADGDAAVLDAGSGDGRALLEGGGELALARLRPAAAQSPVRA